MSSSHQGVGENIKMGRADESFSLGGVVIFFKWDEQMSTSHQGVGENEKEWDEQMRTSH